MAGSAATDAHPLSLLVDAHIRFVGRHQPSSESGHEREGHDDAAESAQVNDTATLAAEDQPWVGPGLGGHGSSLTHWIADAMFASGLYWGLHIEELLGGGAINRKWALQRLLACRARCAAVHPLSSPCTGQLFYQVMMLHLHASKPRVLCLCFAHTPA